ncbi:hypothetical protein [Candidatus Lariskella endosymbiont of Hedychridium roseum]|uniref:hypothetical protein n=1 Tax=Candidatus Lariskella endosymbiont of Hedychridium roseum TaxID=3077949 RepID=UPI0030D01827
MSTNTHKVGIDVSPEDKGEALTYAVACTVGNDQSGLVYCILNKAGKDISKEDKSKALASAATKGYTNLVRSIIKMVGEQILSEAQSKALVDAVEEDNKEVAGAILEDASQAVRQPITRSSSFVEQVKAKPSTTSISKV